MLLDLSLPLFCACSHLSHSPTRHQKPLDKINSGMLDCCTFSGQRHRHALMRNLKQTGRILSAARKLKILTSARPEIGKFGRDQGAQKI